MKYPIETTHGHTVSELEALLEDSCDIFDDFVVLERRSMGGWTNINIRGNSSDFEFVLKLPWSNIHYKTNPYTQLYKLGVQYARLNIAPHPIEMGRLRDSTSTPYLLIEYVEAQINFSRSRNPLGFYGLKIQRAFHDSGLLLSIWSLYITK